MDLYQLLIDSIEDVAWLIDKDGRFLLVNQAFLKLYNSSEEQVIGKTYFDLVDEKTASTYRNEDMQVMSTLESKHIECYITAEIDGWLETEWLETILTPAIGKQGECVGVIGLSRDITEQKQKLQSLEEHQEWMDLYFQIPMVGMGVIKQDLSWVDCNNNLLNLLGYDKKTLFTTHFTDHLEQASKYKFSQLLRTIKALNQKQLNLELEFVNKDKKLLVCDFHLRLVNDGLHDNCFVVSVDDVTEHREVSEKLILANQVLEASAEAVLITDAKKKIIRVNQAFTQLTGYTEKEVLGKSPKLLKSGRNTEEIYENMWLTIEKNGSWQGEIWDRRKDGTTYPKWMTISTIYKPNTKQPTHYFAIFSDVTEKKLAENKIKYLAYHDDLTGLANKTLFETRLVAGIKEAEVDLSKIAVIQLDIDNFKNINDSLGHYVGDALIQAVAVQIRACLRVTDLIARVGGDEFLILLEKVKDFSDVEQLATKIHQRFHRPLDVLNHKMHVSMSIGICIYPEDGENHEAILRNVDTALNRAKTDGKNQIAFFTKEMSQSVMKRLRLEYELRSALENKEFRLVYQPQIDVHTHKIIAVEALLRWESEHGVISPLDFIPVAEETGLINEIGAWVLDQSCQDLADWLHLGVELELAINLSGHQFEYNYLITHLTTALEANRLDAEHITLEITEGVLVANSKEALKLSKTLNSMGFKLAIDDFGTGYSSLSYLKAFAVDQLKIDRTFVEGLPEDRDSAAIVDAILSLAKSLKLSLIAEGVETELQLNYLHGIGCHLIQGFYFSKPLSKEDVILYYQEWQKSEKAIKQ